MTVSSASSGARGSLSAPRWIWGAMVTLAALALLPFIPAFPSWPYAYMCMAAAYGMKSSAEVGAFLWASRRAELGARLQQALRISAGAFALSALLALAEIGLFVVPPPESRSGLVDAAFSVATFVTYLVGLAGILRMPMSSARQPAASTYVLDYTASVLGTAAVLIALVTMPSIQTAPRQLASVAWSYGASQIAMLVGANTLVLRGVARPGPRAFWLFVSMVLANLLTVTIAQFEMGRDPDGLSSHLSGVATSVVTFWAAVSFRTDPIHEESARPGPRWYVTFNPLPLVATVGVALLLLVSAFRRDAASVTLLAVVMVIQASVLILRLFLTARENERLQRQEAERQRAQQAEKMEAIGRLAGGMAHWYNNLLTTVIGHAELGALQTHSNRAAREGFAEIRQAADRAAALTHQLLSYSGRQYVRPRPVHAARFLADVAASLEATWPGRIAVTASIPPDVRITADAAHLTTAIRELAANAIDASGPEGGIEIRGGIDAAGMPGGQVILPIEPGPCLALSVVDHGRGINPGSLGSIFDPFFTTKPTYAAAGLGLASVYGIVSAHKAGLAVDSAPGRGTTMTLYLAIETDGSGVGKAAVL